MQRKSAAGDAFLMRDLDRGRRLGAGLLIRLGGLGDLLAVLPSIRLLQSADPGSRLTLVGREEYGTLFTQTGLVDEIESESRPWFSRLYGEPGEWGEETASRVSGFDFVLGWMQSPGGRALESAVRSLSKPCHLVVYDAHSGRTVSRFFYDETARLLGPAAKGLPAFEACFFLPLTDHQKRAGRRLAAKTGIPSGSAYVVIHPGSGGLMKRWPLERFRDVAGRLGGRGMPGLFVTGEAEADLEALLENEPLPSGWRLITRPKLMDLAGLLAGAAFYIGNDCGVTHLAAACGTRVLAIFRSESEPIWRPGGHSLVFSADSVENVAAEKLWRAAEAIPPRP